MRFLLDQDVYEVTARFLEGLGHDVVRAAQIGHESYRLRHIGTP